MIISSKSDKSSSDEKNDEDEEAREELLILLDVARERPTSAFGKGLAIHRYFSCLFLFPTEGNLKTVTRHYHCMLQYA